MLMFISNDAFNYFFTIPMIVSVPMMLALAGIHMLRD